MSEQQCPVCTGKGGHTVMACPGFREVWATCSACDGKGVISAARAHLIAAGNVHYEARIKRGVTLRAEARRLGVDVIELSQFEHQGILTDRLAIAIGTIPDGPDQRQENVS